MSVKLKKKKLAGGRQSLYLDIYREGQCSSDVLGLYLGKDCSTNKERMCLAEGTRARKEQEIQSQPHSFASRFKQDMGIVAYFEQHTQSKRDSVTAWRNTLNHLWEFTVGKLRLAAVDEWWLETSKLSSGSRRLRACNTPPSRSSEGAPR
ncbi:MAG TPA: hypothetical protein VKP65_08540 [Rhodothermales bacterium]|nr:hypothetical protein [Rhodothermales bacterium]